MGVCDLWATWIIIILPLFELGAQSRHHNLLAVVSWEETGCFQVHREEAYYDITSIVYTLDSQLLVLKKCAQKEFSRLFMFFKLIYFIY